MKQQPKEEIVESLKIVGMDFESCKKAIDVIEKELKATKKDGISRVDIVEAVAAYEKLNIKEKILVGMFFQNRFEGNNVLAKLLKTLEANK